MSRCHVVHTQLTVASDLQLLAGSIPSLIRQYAISQFILVLTTFLATCLSVGKDLPQRYSIRSLKSSSCLCCFWANFKDGTSSVTYNTAINSLFCTGTQDNEVATTLAEPCLYSRYNFGKNLESCRYH